MANRDAAHHRPLVDVAFFSWGCEKIPLPEDHPRKTIVEGDIVQQLFDHLVYCWDCPDGCMVDVGGRPVVRMIVTSLLATNLLLIASLAPGNDSWVDRCVAVIDGDTIVVARGAERIEVDLARIDCPELGQPFGEEAKAFTAGMVCRQIAKIEIQNSSDGHVFGRVTVFGKDLPLELVKAGLAWHDNRKIQDPAVAKAENEARQADRGLWSEQDSIAPWVWRL